LIPTNASAGVTAKLVCETLFILHPLHAARVAIMAAPLSKSPRYSGLWRRNASPVAVRLRPVSPDCGNRGMSIPACFVVKQKQMVTIDR